MTSAFSIYAGTVDDVRPDSGDWIIVDLSISEADAGLTESGAPCCVYRPGGDLHESTFGEAANLVIEAAGEAGQPLNLLIDAPLSAAFDKGLNPIPRSIERKFFQGSQPGAGVALSDRGRPPTERNDAAPPGVSCHAGPRRAPLRGLWSLRVGGGARRRGRACALGSGAREGPAAHTGAGNARKRRGRHPVAGFHHRRGRHWHRAGHFGVVPDRSVLRHRRSPSVLNRTLPCSAVT